MSTRRMYAIGLVAAASLCCVWVALAQSTRKTPAMDAADVKDAALRDLARLVTMHELYKLHWTKLESDTEFRTVIEQFSDCLPKRPQYRWKAQVIPARVLNELVPGLDEFDRKAVAAVQRGEDETWQIDAQGGVRFATAIRAKAHCVSCHPVRFEGESVKPIMPNDIIGVMSITMNPRHGIDTPDELRAAIEHLRRVATEYSDNEGAKRILDLLNKHEEEQNK